jgi:hypothetical protein
MTVESVTKVEIIQDIQLCIGETKLKLSKAEAEDLYYKLGTALNKPTSNWNYPWYPYWNTPVTYKYNVSDVPKYDITYKGNTSNAIELSKNFIVSDTIALDTKALHIYEIFI